jgi:hypothetical protein
MLGRRTVISTLGGIDCYPYPGSKNVFLANEIIAGMPFDIPVMLPLEYVMD